MEPEGIVHALRHLCEALVPGGIVLDLQAIRPSGRVEVDGNPIGRIDDDVFFARARQAVAGLDALIDEGLLARGREMRFETLVRYDAGAELVKAITDSSERRLPDELAARLADAGPCVVRETSFIRVLGTTIRGRSGDRGHT
jgi:hypothetical protein